MEIQVLMSTMNQNNNKIIGKSQINNGVIINQCGKDSKYTVGSSIKWVDSSSKGLSTSRNLAIQNSNAEICLLADDDMIYIEKYEDIIKEYFNKLNADIICFQVEGIERPFKKYGNKMKNIGYLSALKVSSVEIAFRTESIIQNKLVFDEKFGSGAIFKMGEENIFLYDALRKGLKIKYVPLKIADLHLSKSSWFKGFNSEYLQNRGAVFYRMSKIGHLFLILQFAIRKRKLFNNMNVVRVFREMFRGAQKYKKLKN